MIGPRMRPRFEVVVPQPAPDVLAHIQTRLDDPDCLCTGSIVGKHVHLEVPPADRTYWSPHLWVDVYPSEGASLIHGLFGPHPSVWTMFIAMYAVLGFGAVLALLIAFSQYTLGRPPTALWAVPLTTALAVIVYLVALTGQRLSYAQMVQLREIVDAAVGQQEES